MVTDSAAHAVCGLDASIFVCDQSYGNSWPQSRQTTYVPVTDAAAMLRRSLPRTVMGKLRRWCQQPKTRSNRLISPPQIEAAIHAASRDLHPVSQSGNRFRLPSGYLGPRTGGVKRGHDPSTNRHHQSKNTMTTMIRIVSRLISKFSEKNSDRSRLEQSVQKRTHAGPIFSKREPWTWTFRKVDAQHYALSHSRFRSRSLKFRGGHSPA